MHLKNHIFNPKTLSTIQSRLFNGTFIRTTSTAKQYVLGDALTTEIKKSIEAKWGPHVYGAEAPETCQHVNGKHAYVLSMFPYPSGRLHLGHVRVYTVGDIIARFYRMRGYEVIHPMGWDAFGLPAENAARDRGVEPESWTRDNIAAMRKQIIDMGCCFDWSRELATCDVSYYKWTQWLFVKLWNEGLAYKKRAYVYWDPVDKTVLAEEQVDDDMRSWRSGVVVEKKLLSQWFVRTAVYGQRLASGLESSFLKDGWRDVIELQKHWLGSMHGFFSDCKVLSDDSSLDESLRIWFTSPEPLRHAQFVIIQPDHYLAKNDDHVFQTYPNGLKQMNFMVLNPATGINLPVFSGGPDMPIVPESADCRIDEILNENVYPEIAVNDHQMIEIRKVCQNRKLIGTFHPEHTHPFIFHSASLKLRDWLVSRQRKWGTPIPAINCNDCGKPSAVDTSHLPFNKNSDLSSLRCYYCGSSNVSAETDTLDTFFDSSWYFFRYLDVNNDNAIFDPKRIKPYLPVDIYVGGKEHATLHLYYARFMTYFLEKLGLTSIHEPFQNLVPVGVVMGETYKVSRTGRYISGDQVEERNKRLVDKETGLFVTKKWEKMSKSKNNGIDPELIIQEYGVDTTRLLSMAAVAPTSYRKWPSSEFPAYLKFQAKLWQTIREFTYYKEKTEYVIEDDDDWKQCEDSIFDKRNYYLRQIIHNYEKTYQISIVVSRLQGVINYLFKVPKPRIKNSIQYERTLGTAIICMYPIMPAFSAHMWQSFRDVASFTENEFDLEKEIWCQKFPHIDPNYNLELICEVFGNQICSVKVPRAILDNLDLSVALEMALEQPEVEKRVARETCEVISYKVEPNYQATLNIKCTEKEKRKLSNANIDK